MAGTAPKTRLDFDKHERKIEAGTEKEAKDRLKDLAAWRLYGKLGWGEALKFAEQHRKRDESGESRIRSTTRDEAHRKRCQ
jgi:hypothetical protein